MGTRTRRRSRADAPRSESASHACAPRIRRASVRHAEDADGCDALSDEAVAQCSDRNGAERTQLQSHACAEHRRHQAIAGSHAGVRRAPTAAPRCTEVQEGLGMRSRVFTLPGPGTDVGLAILPALKSEM